MAKQSEKEPTKTIEITLPRTFWDQVKQKGSILDVDLAEDKDLPKIVIRALEKCLGVYREPPKSTIHYKP